MCLHLQGRAHCDIKPQNIRVLLGVDGEVLQCGMHDLGASVEYQGELMCSQHQSVVPAVVPAAIG